MALHPRKRLTPPSGFEFGIAVVAESILGNLNNQQSRFAIWQKTNIRIVCFEVAIASFLLSFQTSN